MTRNDCNSKLANKKKTRFPIYHHHTIRLKINLNVIIKIVQPGKQLTIFTNDYTLKLHTLTQTKRLPKKSCETKANTISIELIQKSFDLKGNKKEPNLLQLFFNVNSK